MTDSVSIDAQPQPAIYPRNQHTLSRTKIDPDALKIMYRLARHGYKAYLVGGGVRDVLLGKAPKDFDIATDATPRQVKALFRNSRIIGRRFKLVHIFFPSGKNIEVSTFRDINDSQEDESDTGMISRDNNFGTEATDALRRDLTINALFYDISTHAIIDYVGGMKDLRDGYIRVIGNPDVRFTEDPVRLVRVVRHAARTGFKIEEKCKRSLTANTGLLMNASQVRVYEEVKKDLVSGYCLPSLRLLHDSGLLSMIMPWLEEAGDRAIREGAHLPICLERIDVKVKEGAEISPTVVLTLLALYCTPSGISPEGIQRFSSDDEFEEHIKGVYSKLLVPRKERERMTALARAFEKISSYDGKQRGGFGIRPETIPDLKHLYEAVLGEEPDPELFKVSAGKKRRRKRSSRSGGQARHG